MNIETEGETVRCCKCRHTAPHYPMPRPAKRTLQSTRGRLCENRMGRVAAVVDSQRQQESRRLGHRTRTLSPARPGSGRLWDGDSGQDRDLWICGWRLTRR